MTDVTLGGDGTVYIWYGGEPVSLRIREVRSLIQQLLLVVAEYEDEQEDENI